MSFEGKNIVKNSVTLNEVTKASADALPNRDGKYLNVDGDLYKDDGSKLVKQINNDSDSTRWGMIYRGNTVASDFTVTGDAEVLDSSSDGSYDTSFRVDTGTAGNTVEIEVPIPAGAIDTRNNQTRIQYRLFDIDDPVLMEVVDWNGDVVGSINLNKTGSSPATADNLRFKIAKVDWTLPFIHGSSLRNMKFRFSCASNITTGSFLVNFIDSNSDYKATGDVVERETVNLYGGSGYGSTDTTVAEFTGANSNTENSLYKVVSNSVNGTVVEVKRTAFFSLEARVSGTPSNGYYGFTFNSTQLTSSFNAIDQDKRKGGSWWNTGTTAVDTTNWSGEVEQGVLIRLQGGAAIGIDANSYFEISASVNHRTITSVNERIPDIITAKVTPTDTIENENYEGFFTGFSRSGNSVTLTFPEQQEAPTLQTTLVGNVSLVEPRNLVCTTTSCTWEQKSFNDSNVSVDYSYNVALSRSSKDISLEETSHQVLKTTYVDGQEYETDEIMVVGGVRYPVFERTYLIGTTTLSTIQTGLKMLNILYDVPADNKVGVSGMSREGTLYSVLEYNYSTGAVSNINAGAWTLSGSIHTLRYYDPARPL